MKFLDKAKIYVKAGDGGNGSARLGDLILVGEEVTFYIPAGAVNGIFGAEKGEFPFHLRNLRAVCVHAVPGHPGKQFLLDIGTFKVVGIINMELFSKGEHFAFYKVAVSSYLVLDGEFITPGKYFLFDIELHCSASFMEIL
jgi:hypothetical protein